MSESTTPFETLVGNFCKASTLPDFESFLHGQNRVPACRICHNNDLTCVKHGIKIDVWYDCQGCCEDASTWSDLNGFTQCVSPYITRAGTDNGKWVKLNSERWQWVTHICLCQKCPSYYEDYPDEWAKFSNN